MKKYFLHLYIGSGKGKTTSGYGAVLRAIGAGKKVLAMRFLKPCKSGEIIALEKYFSECENLTLKNFEALHGFVRTDEDVRELKDDAKAAFDFFKESALSGNYDFIFLDEFIDAINLKLIPEGDFLKILEGYSGDVILTGRNPSDCLIDAADYVSEIKKIKHPYDGGTAARRGIEY